MVRVSNETIEQLNNLTINSIKDIEKIEDEGLQTYYLTKYLLEKHHKKQDNRGKAIQRF